MRRVDLRIALVQIWVHRLEDSILHAKEADDRLARDANDGCICRAKGDVEGCATSKSCSRDESEKSSSDEDEASGPFFMLLAGQLTVGSGLGYSAGYALKTIGKKVAEF